MTGALPTSDRNAVPMIAGERSWSSERDTDEPLRRHPSSERDADVRPGRPAARISSERDTDDEEPARRSTELGTDGATRSSRHRNTTPMVRTPWTKVNHQ